MRSDWHLSEYFLLQTLWTLFRSRFIHRQRRPYAAFETQAILDAWQHLPANVVRPERNKRQHLSSVLSRNEIERDYTYNRALFTRVTQGWYQLNPKLSVRRRRGDEEIWVPIYAALNLPLINEAAWDDRRDSVGDRIAEYLALAGLPARTIPIAAERTFAREQALAREKEEREEEQRAALERRRKQQAETWLREQPEKPKWGTPEAKRQEIERIRREIEERKKR